MPHLSTRYRALIFCLCSFIPIGFAQETPKPKILTSPPPGQVVWTVSYTYTKTRENLRSENKDALEKAQVTESDLERFDKITYTIKKPVSSRITTYDGGGKSEAYLFEDSEFFKKRGAKEVDKQKVTSTSDPQQLYHTKFPGVEWVKPKLFVKILDAYGESCAFFREEAAVVTAEQLNKDDLSAQNHSVREAWFSMKTGLPVAYKEMDMTGKFKFADPATATVNIPQDVREKIAKYAKYMEFIKRRNTPVR